MKGTMVIHNVMTKIVTEITIDIMDTNTTAMKNMRSQTVMIMFLGQTHL